MAGLLLLLAIAIQAGSDAGAGERPGSRLLGVTGLTGVLLFPLFRVWLRKAALPLGAPPPGGPGDRARRLEASPRDWRRWAVASGGDPPGGRGRHAGVLIGVLGTGGTAEGVVVGMIAAWGAATLEDVGRIHAAEAAEGRRYYAACRRPTGVGGKLVWITAR